MSSFAIQVPLWAALALRRRNSALIIIPEWLHLDKIEALLEKEQQNRTELEDMPFYYIEIAHALFQGAASDFPQAELPRIKSTLRSLREIRLSKIQEAIREITEAHTNLDPPIIWSCIGNMELNIVRPLLTTTLGLFNRIRCLRDGHPLGGEFFNELDTDRRTAGTSGDMGNAQGLHTAAATTATTTTAATATAAAAAAAAAGVQSTAQPPRRNLRRGG